MDRLRYRSLDALVEAMTSNNQPRNEDEIVRSTADADKHVDGPCWGPLERVAELTIVSPALPVIDPGHFMYMARLESSGQPDLNLYKHFYTRYYLNLDDAGHAYVFVGTA